MHNYFLIHKFIITASNCKEQWKHLRGSYTRYLKSNIGSSGSATKSRKPYYFVKHMHFLQPFTKSRQSVSLISYVSESISEDSNIKKGNNMLNSMQEASADELGSETQHTNDVQPPSLFCDELTFPPPNKKQKNSKHTISLTDVNKSAFEYFQSKKNVGLNISKKKIQDPDESFLMSVLPDMIEMNSEQKKRFKIGILKMAGDILSEFSYRPTPKSFSNFTSTPSSIINNDLLQNSSSESPS